MMWACPLVIEFLGLFCLFGFLTVFFFIFFLEIFTCPLVWGVIPVGVFHERKIIQAQKGSARDILFRM